MVVEKEVVELYTHDAVLVVTRVLFKRKEVVSLHQAAAHGIGLD